MKAALLFGHLLLALTVEVLLAAESSDPAVTLKNGQIRGEFATVRGTDRRVKQYLGVPYARPPVGPLRLAAPQSAEPWEGEKDCTHQPAMCIQDPQLVVLVSQTMSMTSTPTEISEDCLYLNVYTPAEATKGDKLPVMVWIHGGGLTMGAASQFDGSPLAAYENMVVVVIQYRLGILGFFSTGDEHARGNWGLLDQLAALRWVKENIEVFGGDPQLVTLAGESAGGISASILTLSPHADGLFQRAIFQSGVATLGTYTTDNPLSHARVIANITGCSDSNTEELVRCIRGKTQDELVAATKKMKIFLGAVVDNDFLHGTAETLLSRKEVLKVPVMMGITNHEFGWILPQSFGPPGWEKGMSRESVLAVINLFNPGVPSANVLIADEYLKDAQTPEQIRDAFTEVIGDLLMTLSVIKVAGYHTDAAVPVYLYEFVYSADLYKDKRPSFVKADHADDVCFVFGGCFWNEQITITGNVTGEDERVCRTMMSYWANFARTGSPNGPGLVSWPQYDREKQEYMELGLAQAVKQKLKENRVHFAAVTLPQKLQQQAAAAKEEQ
ncbi:carboxylesterase 3 [Oryzias melastigma]|uniref:Carboxylic ester hydrolase n=1 Tax=Oryzias melastigma TaxID=30732 RepID=A0A3B3C9J1_ORYME|nr:carboxylesterase 3 [Oryzias melastigma]